MQFCRKNALVDAVFHFVTEAVKSSKRFRGCRNRLQRTNLHGSLLPGQSSSQKFAFTKLGEKVPLRNSLKSH